MGGVSHDPDVERKRATRRDERRAVRFVRRADFLEGAREPAARDLATRAVARRAEDTSPRAAHARARAAPTPSSSPVLSGTRARDDSSLLPPFRRPARTMPTAAKHLIITSARGLPASTVSSCVSAYGLDPDAAIVLTHCALAPDGSFAGALATPQSVDKLVSLADDPDTWHAPEVLAAVSRSLRPGGSFVAATLPTARAHLAVDADGARAATVAKCLVAGLVPTPGEAAREAPKGVAAAVSTTKPATWEKGAAFSLRSRRLKENAPPPRDAPDAAAAAQSWKVLNTVEDELLDDDALLDESELRAGADEAAAAKARGGGATSKSACKNCS